MLSDNFDIQIKKIFPPDLAKFEYMGFLYRIDKKVNKVSISLGLNEAVVNKALDNKSDLLLIHNSPENLEGSNYYKEIKKVAKQNNLSIYRAHLPMDFAKKGLIENLCKIFKLSGKPVKLKYQKYLISGGVYISNQENKFEDLIKKIKKINPKTLRIAGIKKKKYRKIAITIGDGCKPEFLEQLRPDAFICGLLNQESERIAKDLRVTIFEATSYATENEPLKIVFKDIKNQFKDLEFEFIDVGDTTRLLSTQSDKAQLSF